MKKIKILDRDDYRDYDCKRIQRIMAKKGYDISIEEAKILWEKFSDSMAAGWLRLDDNDELVFQDISPYFEEA